MNWKILRTISNSNTLVESEAESTLRGQPSFESDIESSKTILGHNDTFEDENSSRTILGHNDTLNETITDVDELSFDHWNKHFFFPRLSLYLRVQA